MCATPYCPICGNIPPAEREQMLRYPSITTNRITTRSFLSAEVVSLNDQDGAE